MQCPFGYYDGCNSCSCDRNGLEICTQRACTPEQLTQPFCNQDCRLVLCPIINCKPNEIIVRKPGECCRECIVPKNCTGISCPEIDCTGQGSFVPDGECCPECTPTLCVSSESSKNIISNVIQTMSNDTNIIVIISCIYTFIILIIGIYIGIFVRKCCCLCNKSSKHVYKNVNSVSTATEVTDHDNIL